MNSHATKPLSNKYPSHQRITIRFDSTQHSYLKTKPNIAEYIRDLVNVDMNAGAKHENA